MELPNPALIAQRRAERPAARDDGVRAEALDGLIASPSANRDRPGYRTRLAPGKPIGTGLIEGACENTIGARLEINNPRRRVRRAERMGTLRCLQYSDLWNAYWLSKTG